MSRAASRPEVPPENWSTLNVILEGEVDDGEGAVHGTSAGAIRTDAAYDCFLISIWQDLADDEANIRWARDLWTAMRPFSTGGVYFNNLGDEGEDRVLSASGDNYQRMVALKNKFDPTNVFRLNQNGNLTDEGLEVTGKLELRRYVEAVRRALGEVLWSVMQNPFDDEGNRIA